MTEAELLEHKRRVSAWKYATNRKLREEVLAAYGGVCACCGESTYEFLAIDHHEVSGKEHRQQVKREVYRDLRQRGFPPGFRVLCHNCNMAIGFYGECPHKKKVKNSIV